MEWPERIKEAFYIGAWVVVAATIGAEFYTKERPKTQVSRPKYSVTDCVREWTNKDDEAKAELFCEDKCLREEYNYQIRYNKEDHDEAVRHAKKICYQGAYQVLEERLKQEGH